MVDAFNKAIEHARELALLESISATVEWDERTQMPAMAGDYRAEQLTLLSGLRHQRATDGQYGEWLRSAKESAGLAHEQVAAVRVLLRDYEKATKLPQELVEALTKNEIEGQQAWITARRERDFKILEPFLRTTIELNREASEAIGFSECPYDALMDKYEPQETTANVERVFSALRDQLVPLLRAIQGSDRKAPEDLLHRKYPVDVQRTIGMEAAEAIGFDFQQGRLDVTNHPFCTTLGPNDVRLTTRYDEDFFSSAFFGTLHEAGHGIYEQGLRKDWFGLPPGKYCSMAMHESQSRLYENLVGRSAAFWEFFFPKVQSAFPGVLGDVKHDAFYQAINQVTPSLIRVEADEVTYNLHIIIRFELEQEMINGDLSVSDLPDAWNERYQQFLGITPPHDGDGVLQDIHWSAGYIGYFPTYALGNLYAAQLFDTIENELGTVQLKSADDFVALREWLSKNVHQHGQCYPAKDLIENVSGHPLSESHLIERLKLKYKPLYEI